jgi:agmatinase
MKMKIGLAGFPIDSNSSYFRGAALAPPVIRESFYSDSSNSWSESGIDLSAPDLIKDAGDFAVRSVSEIEPIARDLLAADLSPVSLGGDHSITYPLVRAIHEKFPGLAILHFDAHPDLYDHFEDNRYSHASPFARIMEEGLAQRLVQVGIRTLNRHQSDQAKKFGVEIIEMKNWDPAMLLSFDQPVYISLDMDALDPAYAPGVSHREGGGLSTREAVSVIQKLKARVVAADLVEFNPKLDSMGITAAACSKLLKELISKILE